MSVKMPRIFLSIAGLLLLAIPQINMAAGSSRAGEYELTFQARHMDSTTISFDNEAGADINSDLGFGFSFGYNVNDNLALRGKLSWLSAGYTATRILDDGNGTVEKYSSTLDASTLGFGADYYFGRGKISPFVGGSIGWTFVDTNIPSGPPSSVCWWDPWWGYVCNTTRPTFSSTEFSYGAEIGFRFDLNKKTFIRTSIGEYYIDYSNTSGDTSSSVILVDFGVMLK